ncbi:hypothetical protein H4582DRAFT_2061277 [Lactarius indigo]|nr:hypothetical protein H4582DRAFT_2061277 [Lactarius indigo]
MTDYPLLLVPQLGVRSWVKEMMQTRKLVEGLLMPQTDAMALQCEDSSSSPALSEESLAEGTIFCGGQVIADETSLAFAGVHQLVKCGSETGTLGPFEVISSIIEEQHWALKGNWQSNCGPIHDHWWHVLRAMTAIQSVQAAKVRGVAIEANGCGRLAEAATVSKMVGTSGTGEKHHPPNGSDTAEAAEARNSANQRCPIAKMVGLSGAGKKGDPPNCSKAAEVAAASNSANPSHPKQLQVGPSKAIGILSSQSQVGPSKAIGSLSRQL